MQPSIHYFFNSSMDSSKLVKSSLFVTALVILTFFSLETYGWEKQCCDDSVPITNSFPREPINFKQTFTAPSGVSLFDVPTDKRLVIETVSVRVLSTEILDEIKACINIDGGSQRENIRYYIPIFNELNTGSDGAGSVGTQNMRVYVGPGINVSGEISKKPETGDHMVEFSVSGYLLPLESPTLSP